MFLHHQNSLEIGESLRSVAGRRDEEERGDRREERGDGWGDAGVERAWWVVVECACRILGISTAAVLCAVGVETLKQGQFHSLAIYLLLASCGILLIETAYFLDAFLTLCLPCPPDRRVFVFWGKLARVGGFQKFLYYTMMSLVCFLHPVLVWHAVIPGTMLLVTAFFNFILSKKDATDPKGPQDPELTTVSVEERGGSVSAYSFFPPMAGGRGAGAPVFTPRDGGFSRGDRRESTQAMLERPKAPKDRESRKWGGERRKDRGGPLETEMEEMERETTSDTAPMIID